MKLFLAITSIALSSALGFGQEAEFSIEQSLHKFPKTNEGIVLEHTYTFANTGKSPLIIYEYKVQCTCTKVILPQKPIEPGNTGSINVIFDSTGKTYYQDREVILQMNTKKKTHKLRFKVFIEPKA